MWSCRRICISLAVGVCGVVVMCVALAVGVWGVVGMCVSLAVSQH